MQYLAHLMIKEDTRREQPLREHLRTVAQYAEATLAPVGLGKTGFLAGVLHDCGKYTEKYQNYLERAANGEEVVRGSVIHTFQGVIWAEERWHSGDSYRRLTAEVLMYACGAHHGEFDPAEPQTRRNGFLYRTKYDRQEIEFSEAKAAFEQEFSPAELDALFEKSVEEVTEIVTGAAFRALDKKNFHFGMLARLVLSAVIDGDRRDTAEFEAKGKFPQRQTDFAYWHSNRVYLERKLQDLPDSDSPINLARSDFSAQCLAAAERAMGIYRMSLPTGAGKTLAALRYALRHNEIFSRTKRRIVFIIPLLTVIDQNRKVFHKFLESSGDILEHHSNVVQEDGEPDENEQAETLAVLAAWDKPFVVSTLYQLLNLLFSHKTSDIRRMQSLIGATVILDEVQSLPIKTTGLFVRAMNFLSAVCKTTVVLSTATQPEFEQSLHLQYAPNPELCQLTPAQQKIFTRVEIVDKTGGGGWGLEKIGAFARTVAEERTSLLVICNTTAQARKLYEELQGLQRIGGAQVFHLSTQMCQKHREQVLDTIINGLDASRKGGDKIICVATQLVEAGVDFSFESVIRFAAGLHSIAQAAGRCNRSGEYPGCCPVYLVEAQNEQLGFLKEIQAGKQKTIQVLSLWHKNPDAYPAGLLGSAAIETYYQRYFSGMAEYLDYPVEKPQDTLASLLSYNGKNKRTAGWEDFVLHQSFYTAHKQFQVYDDAKTDVLVPFGEGAALIADLFSEKAKHDKAFAFQTLKKAEPYCVGLFCRQVEKLKDFGMITLEANGLVLTLNPMAYNKETGVITEDF